MAFQFPPGPAVDQTFTPVAGVTYRWSGTAWHLIAGPGSFITTADADTRYVNVDEAQNTTNRIINGKFAIDQRNAGAAKTTGPNAVNYTLDRWSCLAFGDTGVVLVVRQPDGGLPGEYQLAVVANVADTAISAAEYYAVSQLIEGYNVADLNFGTAQASAITIAFEIVSTITGTFCIHVGNAAQNRSYVAPFTVNAISTREQKVITIPGDTTGTWERTTGNGLTVGLSFGVGSNFQGAATTWLAGNIASVAGATNLMATANNTIYLKNFRLYKGAVDFGPDRRLYAEELALCQRYYEKSYNTDTVPGTLTRIGAAQFNQARAASTLMYSPNQTFKVVKRAVPAMTYYNPDAAGNQINNFESSTPFTATTEFSSGQNTFAVSGTTPASSSVGQICGFQWTASTEL